MTTENTDQPESNDPFFRLTDDSEWNACTGPQASDEDYLEGYIQAALELASAVIDKRMYDKRDTLAMPILYNARHAVELVLKYVIGELHRMGVLTRAAPQDHDILSHWNDLAAGPLGDTRLRVLVAALEPFVASLSRVDDDGQALRYLTRRDGNASLADSPLVNIAVIRGSLEALQKTMTSLQHRVLDLAQERLTGSFTPECSRSDLLEIARMLPPRSRWSEPEFDEAKTAAKARFNLSNRKFSAAVKAIERSREMRLITGLETALQHLTDEEARFAVQQWLRRHPPRPPRNDHGIVTFSRRDWEAMGQQRAVAEEVSAAIVAALTPDKIADLEAVFYVGRDKLFCEHYERKLATTKKQHAVAGNLLREVDHLMQKTNFQSAFARGVDKLGRPGLAAELNMIGAG